MSEDDQLKRGSLFRNILLLLTTIVAMLILAVFTPRLFGENIIVKVVVPPGAIGVVVIV